MSDYEDGREKIRTALVAISVGAAVWMSLSVMERYRDRRGDDSVLPLSHPQTQSEKAEWDAIYQALLRSGVNIDEAADKADIAFGLSAARVPAK